MGWAVLAIAVIATASVLWLKRLNPDDPGADKLASTTVRGKRPLKNQGPSRSQPYAAVSIKPGAQACASAHDVSMLRYLKSSAPTLPLESCENAACDCTFVHHADRRRATADGDRRAGIGLKSELYGSSGEPERRQVRGRRSTDRG